MIKEQKYKLGDVVFFNWKSNFFTKGITFYNYANYECSICTHVGIITKIEKDKVLIHEASRKGFISGWYSKKWLEDNKGDLIHIGRAKHRLRNVFEFAEKYIGKRYGYLDILAIIFSWILGWKVTKATGTKSIMCSEAVSRLLYDASDKKINFEKEYNKCYDLITPMDIFFSKQIKLV